MKIDIEFVEKIGRHHGQMPYNPGLDWFKANFPDGAEHEDVFKKAIEYGNILYPAWWLAYSMSKTQALSWAIHCARSVLHIYEAEYHDDMRPRLAIESAEAYLANPCEETRMAAQAAARGAADAARAAWNTAVWAAALSAAWAAAEDTAWAAAENAAWSTWNTAVWAAWHAAQADHTITLDLLNEGYRIWQEEK